MSTLEPPSWDRYAAFLAVMQTGSLSGASRALALAQPTVRRQIESLEASLGIALFTRAQNGLTPTDAAHAALPHAQAIESSAHALVRSASAPTAEDRGTVRVTASQMIGCEVLPPILARLAQTHPAIHLELALDDRNQDLLRREADVAIRMIAPTQAGLVRRHAGSIEIGLFATTGYLAARGTPRTLAELKSHTLVGPDRSRFALDGIARLGLSPRDLALRTDSDVAQLAAVRAGYGIGVCQVPLGGALVRVLSSVRLALDAWVVTHEDLRSVRRVRIVVDHLATELARYATRTVTAARRASARGRA
jgi:DNA-binding transcriptional LysR family regulator